MTLEYMNNKFLTLYLVSLVTLSPYGIPGEANIRVSDFFALLLFISAFLLWIHGKRIYFSMVIVPLLPFLFLEFFTPIAGMVLHGSSSITTSIRTVLMWGPLVLYWGFMDKSINLEKKINFILKLGLIINFIIATMQLLISLGVLSEFILPTYYLEKFAVDEYYKLYSSFRSSGLFTNSTGLALFSMLSFIFYYSRILTRVKGSFFWVSISFMLVLLTTSRAAIGSMFLILFLGFIFSNIKTKIILTVSLTILIGILFHILDTYVGLENYFWRFQRIYDAGLMEDFSFGYRLNILWPVTLDFIRDLPFGTLTSSPRVIGIIDSGYLTYYAQGKWIFVFSLLYMLLYMLVKSFKNIKMKEFKWINLFIFFVTLYIVITMITTNPMRSQIVVVFILISFMLLEQVKNKEKNEKNLISS